jgi:hypothetical protein
MQHCVIAVAGNATWQTSHVKGLLVRTLAKELRLEDVTIGADILDCRYARRHSAMIAMACGTGGRAQITTNIQSLTVNANTVLRELVCGNRVLLHVVCVCVAARTGFRNTQRIHVGSRVGRGAQIMHTVAIGAHRYFFVALH